MTTPAQETQGSEAPSSPRTRPATPLFDPKHARMLVIASGLSIALMLFGMLFLEPPDDITTPEANSFSNSLIGHQAFLALLREADLDVTVSRYDSLSRATSVDSALLLLEPPPGPAAQMTVELWSSALTREVPVLLVLPKWTGSAQEDKPQWLQSMQLRSGREIEALLQGILELDEDGAEGSLQRPERPGAEWRSPWPELEIDLPRPQLIRVPKSILMPVVSSSSGVLVGRVPGHQAYVLSDPDLLNTRGLRLADNAVLSYRLVRHLSRANTVVVDETLHGFDYRPSLVRELLSYPLVLVFSNILVLLVATLWAGGRRFGSPQPPPPKLRPGKQTLIESTAELLHAGANTAYDLRRYLQMSVRLVARACSLPEDLKPDARLQRLAAIGRGRGVRSDVRQLADSVEKLSSRGVDVRRALRLGRAIYRWRKEMTDGIA